MPEIKLIDGTDENRAIVTAVDELMQYVRHFHHHMNVSPEMKWDPNYGESLTLEYISNQLYTMACGLEVAMECQDGAMANGRYLRAHLLLEELAELLAAFATGDHSLALDALSDLLYVLLGAAVMWNFKLPQAFDRVHRSNMTKQPRPSGKSDPRLRDKGDQFKPPYLGDLLDGSVS